MNVEEFLKQVQPAVRRSRLAPHIADIQRLRAAGCSLDQVRRFLAENGVTVSVAGLSSYLIRQTQTQTQSKNNKSAAPAPANTKSGASEIKIEPENTDGLSAKQLAERTANKYFPSDGAGSLSSATRKLLERKETEVIGGFTIERPPRFRHNPFADKDILK